VYEPTARREDREDREDREGHEGHEGRTRRKAGPATSMGVRGRWRRASRGEAGY